MDSNVFDGFEGSRLMAETDLMSSEITSAIVMFCRGELVVVLNLRKGKYGGGILVLSVDLSEARIKSRGG